MVPRFISKTADAIIGDFGLATGGNYGSHPSCSPVHSSLIFVTDFALDSTTVKKKHKQRFQDEELIRVGDLTTGVGTPFYLAPEQNVVGSKYDQKVCNINGEGVEVRAVRLVESLVIAPYSQNPSLTGL